MSTRPNRSSPRPARTPSVEAVEVVAKWPAGAWLTIEELAEHLAETRPVEVTSDGPSIDGRALQSIVNEARRRSWLISDRDPSGPRWGRTPTGAAATS